MSRGGARAKRGALAGFGTLLATLLLGAGCTVGSGSGSASGPIYVLGCTSSGGNYGTPDAPLFFDLAPRFFAGEPIEDIAVALPMNLLRIRVQRNGNRIEVNDTLYFEVQNTYEVARCVRGRTVNGVPDWDTRMTTSTFTELPTATPWCDWSGVATVVNDGGVAEPHARIHLGTEEFLRSDLSLLFTCHQAQLVGVAFVGWIDFEDFGGAAQPLLLPEDRTPVDRDFKVNFGDRLRARFAVTLGDQRIVAAIKAIVPIPPSLIGGDLTGNFDFDLERGRAAQPFP